MKKFITLTAILAIGVFAFAKMNATSKKDTKESVKEVTASPQTTAFTIKFGSRATPDDKGGCKENKGFCLIINSVHDDQQPLTTGFARATISMQDANHLKFSILEDFEKDLSPTFLVTEDVFITPAIAHDLGYQSIKLQSGQYPVDYSHFENGEVVISVESN